MLYRNRFYHPDLGRFLTRDSIGYMGKDFNLFRYVKNCVTQMGDIKGNQFPAELPPEMPIVTAQRLKQLNHSCKKEQQGYGQEDIVKDLCNEKDCLAYEQVLQDMLSEEFQKIRPIKFECRQCAEGSGGSNAKGGYADGRLVLCWNNIKAADMSHEDILQTLTHEIIHAAQ